MCGILGILNLQSGQEDLRKQALQQTKLQRHRGPDWSGIYTGDNAILAHERLAIVDLISGGQPLYNKERTHVLAVNGEIYNHQELKKTIT